MPRALTLPVRGLHGITVPPGNAGLFVYAADVLTVPADAPHPKGALSFLETFLSVEGQEIIVTPDDTPTRTDVKITTTDSEVIGIIDDWRDAEYHLPANTKFIWEGPLRGFVDSSPHDKEALVQVLMTLY